MHNQRIISFDVGIKNMAYCMFDFHPSQPDSLNIMDWNVLNLMEKEEPLFFCNCTNVKTKHSKKPKKEKKIVKLENVFIDSSNNNIIHPFSTDLLCGKPVKYKKNTLFFCEKHAKSQSIYIIPKKQNSDSQLKKKKIEELNLICQDYKVDVGENVKNTKKYIFEKLEDFFYTHSLEVVNQTKKHNAGDTDLITIGKNMKMLLDQVKEIERITHVIIENQISPLANRMKTIQGMLAQYFIMKNDTSKIEFVSSFNKLKEFSKNQTDSEKKESEHEKTEKQKYSQHKKDGVFYTTQIMEKNKTFQLWEKTFHESKKKDDYADCFLQGIWYLRNKMNIHVLI